MKNCLLCSKKLKSQRELSLLICKKCLSDFVLINSDFKLNNKYLHTNNCSIYFKYFGKVKELLSRYKFRKELILAHSICNIFLENLNLNFNYNYIIPAPSHFLRIIKHGFLPVNYFCKAISKQAKLEYLECLEKKFFPIKEQKQLKKNERIKQKNNIYCTTNLSGKNILLVDDIITSGQTINNSIKALKEKNAKNIQAVIFALA